MGKLSFPNALITVYCMPFCYTGSIFIQLVSHSQNSLLAQHCEKRSDSTQYLSAIVEEMTWLVCVSLNQSNHLGRS